jgi:hypothetical protein
MDLVESRYTSVRTDGLRAENRTRIRSRSANCSTATFDLEVLGFDSSRCFITNKNNLSAAAFVPITVNVCLLCAELHIYVCVKMNVVWDVAPCSPVETDLRFRGAYCRHHQAPLKRLAISTRLHGSSSQTTAMFIIAAMGI